MASAKLERLMNLVAALLHTRVPLAASTIRERVGGYAEGQVAFHRQFSRDKEDLREMGVTIRVEPVPESDPPVEGYRIDPDDYYLEDPRLEPDELAALHLATRLIAVGNDEVQPQGLFKLGGMAARGAEPAPPLASMPKDPNLGVLFDTIRENRSAMFVYRGTERRLVPRALGFRGGNWYVSGWDLDQQSRRLYRLDRIGGSVQRGDVSHVEGDPEATIGPLQPWNVGELDHFTSRIRVDAAAVPGVVAQVGDSAVVDYTGDGGALVDVSVTNRDGFRSWILGLGPTVDVVSPPQMRTAVIDWLKDLVGEGT